MALGICTFCLVALLPLMSVGMRNDQESRRTIDAAATASLLLEARRLDPGGTNAFLQDIAMPTVPAGGSINQASNVLIDAGGRISDQPDFLMSCRMQRISADSDVCRVYLKLSTPAKSTTPGSQTHYEVVSCVRLSD